MELCVGRTGGVGVGAGRRRNFPGRWIKTIVMSSDEAKTAVETTLARMVAMLRAGIPGRTAPHPGLADRFERLSPDERMDWMWEQYALDAEGLWNEVSREALWGRHVATDADRRRALASGLDAAMTTVAQNYVADMMAWPAHNLAAMVTQFGAGAPRRRRRRRGKEKKGGGLGRWNTAVERARQMGGYRGRATRGTPLHALATRLVRKE